MTATSATKISVSWGETLPPNGLSIAQYLIFCGASPNPTVQVGTSTSKSYTYSGLDSGTTYYCAVQAVDADRDDSTDSATASATTGVLPDAPTNLAAVANGVTRVTVTWTASTVRPNGLPISSYLVYRGTTPNGLSDVATRTASPYLDTTVSPGVTYYYALVAVDSGQDDSPQSAVAQVTTPVPPIAPTNLAAVANSTTQVTVTWTASAVPPDGLRISSYQIYRGTTPTGLGKVATRTASPYVDSTVSPGVTYYYALVAVDSDQDDSPQSGAVQVTTP
jgi:cellulose 1,4-beta-cellobiosidase